MAIKRFAAIDVGSFELELGIYEIGNKIGIRQIEHIRNVISLGKETYNTGKISYELVEEMYDVLSDFAEAMKTYNVTEYRAYATSAMREARNSQIIIDQIKNRTGIDVKIISNSEQRFISYKAIAAKDEKFATNINEGTAIVDVGFGSMQITLYDKGSMVSTQNLSLGVLRIREMIGRISSARENRLQILGELVDNELATYKKLYLRDIKIKNLIGIGETILYLFTRFSGDSSKDFITKEEFLTLYSTLTTMNTVQIEERFGVSRDFASVLIPCAIIYQRVFELMGADGIWIPGTLLIDGIAAEYAVDKKLLKFKHNFTEDIISVSRNMAKRYRGANAHTQSVESYALNIFDAMKKIHGMSERDRLLLQISAILHNTGKFISMKMTADSTYNIISSVEIIGLSHDERMLVAKVSKNNFQNFSYDEASILIAKLSAILSIANSLDRSHKQKVKDYKFKMKDDELIISTNCITDITLETISFESHKKFFKEIFGINPELKQRKK